jgi:peptide/nickel transport system permease protein
MKGTKMHAVDTLIKPWKGVMKASEPLVNMFSRMVKSKILRKLLKNPISVAGFLLVFFFVVIAILAPYLAPPQRPSRPYQVPRDGYSAVPKPPSAEHPFGTTEGQYDIYYGIIWGTRTAFYVGLVVVGLAATIGVAIGSFSAYYGGLIDEVVMRITDIFMSFPFLVAAMVLTTILGKGLDKVIVALIVFGWMSYARVIRSSILSIREITYVESARAIGASDGRIIFRHVLPNAIFPILVQASMDIGSMVLTAAALSFLGVGAEPGYADWGQMISFARNWILGGQGNPLQFWYTVIFPGAAILLFCLGWNLLGDALRDVLDPRMSGKGA